MMMMMMMMKPRGSQEKPGSCLLLFWGPREARLSFSWAGSGLL